MKHLLLSMLMVSILLSCTIQAKEEKQVTEGNRTYKLSEPFIVMATQNPIELEGTFILPEAELDRFEKFQLQTSNS